MTTLNRRALLTAGAAGLAGLTAFHLEAHTGSMTSAEFQHLAKAPKTSADYKKLAEHLRVLAKEAREEAVTYEAVAKGYRKGIPGANTAQATDAARGLEHVAEHHNDVAEALEHLVDAYEGLAENFAA